MDLTVCNVAGSSKSDAKLSVPRRRRSGAVSVATVTQRAAEVSHVVSRLIHIVSNNTWPRKKKAKRGDQKTKNKKINAQGTSHRTTLTCMHRRENRDSANATAPDKNSSQSKQVMERSAGVEARTRPRAVKTRRVYTERARSNLSCLGASHD